MASPGLALAGYTGRFAPNRLHVLGETEITYLNSLPRGAAAEVARAKFFGFELPCIFVTKGQEVPAELLELAREQRRAGAAQPAQDRRVLPPDQADRRGGVRSPHHAARLAGRRLRRRPAVRGPLRNRQERVRAGPGRAGAPAGGGRRGAGDPPGQRRAHRAGPRARGAPHGDPRHRPHRHPGSVRGARGAAAEADRGGGAAGGLGDRQGQPTGPAWPGRRPRFSTWRCPGWSCR